MINNAIHWDNTNHLTTHYINCNIKVVKYALYCYVITPCTAK